MGLWVSTTQSNKSQVSIRFYTFVSFKKEEVSPNSSFQYVQIMCQTHASGISLLSVYLGEKCIRSLMSQSLEPQPLFDARSCCFVLPFEVMDSSQTMITPRSSQRTGNGSRNSVYESEVYKYPTGEFMFKMCLCKSMLLCSQWQPQWFL